jgi:hypothetical protein
MNAQNGEKIVRRMLDMATLSECAGQGWAELRWYAQSESIIIKTHSKTIVYKTIVFTFWFSFFLYYYSQSRGVKL